MVITVVLTSDGEGMYGYVCAFFFPAVYQPGFVLAGFSYNNQSSCTGRTDYYCTSNFGGNKKLYGGGDL